MCGTARSCHCWCRFERPSCPSGALHNGKLVFPLDGPNIPAVLSFPRVPQGQREDVVRPKAAAPALHRLVRSCSKGIKVVNRLDGLIHGASAQLADVGERGG
jgi:hypothetical protein